MQFKKRWGEKTILVGHRRSAIRSGVGKKYENRRTVGPYAEAVTKPFQMRQVGKLIFFIQVGMSAFLTNKNSFVSISVHQ